MISVSVTKPSLQCIPYLGLKWDVAPKINWIYTLKDTGFSFDYFNNIEGASLQVIGHRRLQKSC